MQNRVRACLAETESIRDESKEKTKNKENSVREGQKRPLHEKSKSLNETKKGEELKQLKKDKENLTKEKSLKDTGQSSYTDHFYTDGKDDVDKYVFYLKNTYCILCSHHRYLA